MKYVWLLLQLDDPYLAPYTAGVYATEEDANEAVFEDDGLFQFPGMIRKVQVGARCDDDSEIEYSVGGTTHYYSPRTNEDEL